MIQGGVDHEDAQQLRLSRGATFTAGTGRHVVAGHSIRCKQPTRTQQTWESATLLEEAPLLLLLLVLLLLLLLLILNTCIS
jgi:hypothetical protein